MPSREKMDDLGLYHPEYTPEQTKDLESGFPYDDEVDEGPKSFEYLKPKKTVDVLNSDLTTEKLSVKETGNENVGRGLFANKEIREGDHVFEFDGIRQGQKKGVISSKDTFSSHSILVGDNKDNSSYFVYAIPNKLSPLRYLNHSCNPNVARISDDMFGFIALRPIKPGEEITADYSLLEANPYWKLENCGCGSPNCKKEIGSVSTLPIDSLYKNWNRLTPDMQIYAIQYSRDPKIAQIRNKLGAEEMLKEEIFRKSENSDTLDRELYYEEIFNSNSPSTVVRRNSAGAELLAPRFLEEFNYLKEDKENNRKIAA